MMMFYDVIGQFSTQKMLSLTANSTKVVNLFFLDVCNLVHAHERKKSGSVSFSDKKVNYYVHHRPSSI